MNVHKNADLTPRGRERIVELAARKRIYEAGSVNACRSGKLPVAYEGETYSYDTPLPGCEKN